MEKVETLVEIGAIVLEFFEGLQGFAGDNCSGEMLSLADSLVFLNGKTLGFSSNGVLLGSIGKIGQMMAQLAEVFLVGVVLLFALQRLIVFLGQREKGIPWQNLIRLIVVGILATGAHYLCFGAVFFTENVTEYVRAYLGEDRVSFSVFGDMLVSLKENSNENESRSWFEEKNVIKILAHVYSIFIVISMGTRYLVLQSLIVSAPVFILFAGCEVTRNIAVRWLKLFVSCLSCQVIVAIMLGIFSMQPFGNGIVEIIFMIAVFIICIRINKIFFNFG